VNLPLANENWPRHRGAAKLAATNGRALRWQEADRVPSAVPEARGELVGYLTGKLTSSPAGGHVAGLIRRTAADA
jgi:hypothetical protein